MDNIKLIEERLSYLEKKYDESEKRIRDLELEIHRLNNYVDKQIYSNSLYE